MFLSFAHTAFRASKREFFAAFCAFFIAFSVFLAVDSLSKAVVSQVELEARPSLGADVAVSSGVPFSEAQESAVFEICKAFSSDCSRKIAFSSTLFDQQGKTALLKFVGVEPGYPYYGDFQFVPTGAETPEPRSVTTQAIPSEKGFLADSAFLARFASGGTVPFFGKNLVSEGVVSKSPESGFSFGEDNGTVIVSYSAAISVPEIKSLSRADFSILAKTKDEKTADALTVALKEDPRLSNVRVRSFRGGAGGAARIVDDVSAYVSEAMAVVFFLAGTAAFFFSKAVWISNRRYFSVLRILGASRYSVSAAFAAFFIAAAAFAAILAAFVASVGLRYVPIPESFGIPSVGWREILRLLETFPFVILPAVIPGVASVFSTPPLSGLGEPKIKLPKLRDAVAASVAALSASFLFLFLISGLPLVASAGKSFSVIAAAAAVLLLAYFSIRLVARAFSLAKTKDFAFTDAVRLAVSPGSPAFPVVSAFLVPAVLLASFSSLAFHFSSELQRLSSSGYDVFAINLKEADASAVRKEFPKSESYSIIRARISRINGKTLSEHLNGEPSREFSREFNVTSSPLPDVVIDGEKRDVKIGEVSLDDEFSRSLGIGVGDTVTFSVMGREFDLKAVNVRASDREGIRPFFYFSVAPGEFSKVPPSYFVAASTPDVDAFKAETLKLS
ncbi:MAG: hypothetical protein QMC36_05925 [Patescibacteria group bacterium]